MPDLGIEPRASYLTIVLVTTYIPHVSALIKYIPQQVLLKNGIGRFT